MKNKVVAILVILLTYIGLMGVFAQKSTYMEAMEEEIARSMESLILEKMLPPGFISYHIIEANTLHIHAVLGGIVKSQERPLTKFDSRILILKDGVSNENYLDRNNVFAWSRVDDNIPFNSSKDDVRRSLWNATDKNYKTALTNFEAKMSARRQQSLQPEELALVDFLPAEKQQIEIPYKPISIDKLALEDLAKSLSAEFALGNINASQVNIYVYDGQVFFTNSEGSSAQYPFQVAAILATASAQLPTGEVLNDHFLHFSNDLSLLKIKPELVGEAKKVATNLSLLTQSPAVQEPYSGPVLFEGQAAAEAFAQVFFGRIDGLVSVRKPIVGDEQVARFAPDRVKENTLESRMGRRIVSRDITIEALPKLQTFQNTNLIGSVFVDAEGITTRENVVLVENGVLTNVLSGRTPTLHVKESNAHARLALNRGGVKSLVAPSVVKMTVKEDATFEIKDLRDMLINEARDEGLEYAYIVRKVVSPMAKFPDDDGMSGMIFLGQSQTQPDLSKTIQVYRVYVNDGREELVSLAEVKGLGVKSFRRILGASKGMQVYNTMYQPVNEQLSSWTFGLTGVPSTYIVPQAILFEELDVVKESQRLVRRPPVVQNPVKK